MSKFISEDVFFAYEDIRKRGDINMFDFRNVQKQIAYNHDLIVEKEDILYLQMHYDFYFKKYNV